MERDTKDVASSAAVPIVLGLAFIGALTIASPTPSHADNVEFWNSGVPGPTGPTGPTGPAGFAGDYGSFYDTSDQTAYPNTVNTLVVGSTAEHVGVNLAANAMNFTRAGVYSVIYSVQFENKGNEAYDVAVWLVKNGVTVPDTNSYFTVHAKHGNDPGHYIGTVNYVLTLAVGDALSFKWFTSAPNKPPGTLSVVSVETIPTDGGLPQSPAVILTATQVR